MGWMDRFCLLLMIEGRNPEIDASNAAVGRYIAACKYNRQSLKTHKKCFICIFPALSNASL